MSEVISFPHAAREQFKLHPAMLRLQGLATVTSELNGMNLRNQDDIKRALWILDLTNRCIKIILSDFRDDPSMDKLIKLAGELADSVERARRMVHHLAFTLSSASVRRH
ncbi:hypothetical protein [Bradyrhizobium sp. RDM4]|uniref:hypothetical protein n=1 Tax=Bradyrhizobium sp. RDM4 TaxID=3378765 RepID=UPI0038FC7250